MTVMAKTAACNSTQSAAVIRSVLKRLAESEPLSRALALLDP
jgi:hypothetical protein